MTSLDRPVEMGQLQSLGSAQLRRYSGQMVCTALSEHHSLELNMG